MVKVGTGAASRFTIKVPTDEEWWFSTRLRAELVKRELATAADLPVDEVGEAAMAAKAAASLQRRPADVRLGRRLLLTRLRSQGGRPQQHWSLLSRPSALLGTSVRLPRRTLSSPRGSAISSVRRRLRAARWAKPQSS